MNTTTLALVLLAAGMALGLAVLWGDVGSERSVDPAGISTATSTAASDPVPDAAGSGATGSEALDYPWDDRNMFFGWSIIGRDKIPFVKDLDMSWASLQPHVLWFEIEREPGVYDWSALDEEIAWLQALDVDVTLVYSTFCNTYDEGLRARIRDELLSLRDRPGVQTLADAWITWNRDLKGPETYDLEPDPFDLEDPMMAALVRFAGALTERYDGDGIDDWDGLRHPLRVHHIVEEWPSPGLDARTYLGYLARLSPAIKAADPHAQVMIPGLYMPNWGRVYAYMDGTIEDPDAGIVDGVRYTREELWVMERFAFGKRAYEAILERGRDHFDLVDVHLYTEKEGFYEGEIAYVKGAMAALGYQKPIWCVEGGGPFRNPETSPDDPQGDPLFGTTSEREVAEYVVKFHAMSAAQGLIRQHWGIGGQPQQGYWGGPWNIMGLLEKGSQRRRPAYYTFRLMREKLRDFGVGNVTDLSLGDLRVFEFPTPRGPVVVAWDAAGTEDARPVDLHAALGEREVAVTGIVTALNDDDTPVVPAAERHLTTAIPLSVSPVFID